MRDPIHDLRRYAADLEASVPEHRARQAVARALAREGRARPRRLVVALATAALLAVGNVALAAAADPAVPGDPLYPLDRAYERLASIFGLEGDTADERLDESQALLERGNALAALETLVEALDDLGANGDLDEARQTLQELAVANGVTDQDFTDAVNQLVSQARLVADAAKSGDPGDAKDAAQLIKEKAQVVAEAARNGNGPPGSPPENPGNGPPDDPGPSSDPPGGGAPDEPGSPGSTAPGSSSDPGAGAPGQENQGTGGGASGDAPGHNDQSGSGAPPSSVPGQGNPGRGGPNS